MESMQYNDQTPSVCDCGLPLGLEKLEQHRVGVKPLCNCLCNLREGNGPEVKKEVHIWGN